MYNYQNSKVTDENTTFRLVLINTEIQKQDYQRKYIVTFDPNGGTVSEASKEVSYHEPYGQLPTPTREGYTFMGWRKNKMKNLFDNNNVISGYYIDEPGTTKSSRKQYVRQKGQVQKGLNEGACNDGRKYGIYDVRGFSFDSFAV